MKLDLLMTISVVVILSTSSFASTLTKIGTANYGSDDYNLIYEDDKNSQGLMWLDFSHEATGEAQEFTKWEDQMDWAAGLNSEGVLVYNFNYGISVSWEDEWRLPLVGNDPIEGFDQTTSEMGHFYYESLKNDAADPFGEISPFENLLSAGYYSGNSPFVGAAWTFFFSDGQQIVDDTTHYHYALAVRPAYVSVPEPSTIQLLVISFVGLALCSRRKFNKTLN